MDIDEVGWANQAGVIEILGVGIKRIEGALLAVMAIVTSAGDVSSKSQLGLPDCIKVIANRGAYGPGQDGLFPEGAHLHHVLQVPFPVVLFTEEPQTK